MKTKELETKERSILETILISVAQNAEQLSKKEKEGVCGFMSMMGHKYDQQLMVVGRAPNGWGVGRDPLELANPAVASNYAKKVFEESAFGNGGDCPMKWVTDFWGKTDHPYNTKRSAFWRVIRDVTGRFNIANTSEADWPSYLVWSNLYKVVPESGRNPGAKLCSIQHSGCLSLFETELSIYLPSRLLLLSGLGWALPFLQHIHLDFHRVPDSYVEAIGQINRDSGTTTKVVIAVHPERKNEGRWVKEVMAAFSQ